MIQIMTARVVLVISDLSLCSQCRVQWRESGHICSVEKSVRCMLIGVVPWILSSTKVNGDLTRATGGLQILMGPSL